MKLPLIKNPILKYFAAFLFLITLLLLLSDANIYGQKTFFVSPSGNDNNSGFLENNKDEDGPLKTLNAALEVVREDYRIDGETSYKIILREGFYPIEQPIEITHKDDYKLTIEAYSGEKPVISAGKKITGWKRSKVNGMRCWKVNLPQVADESWYFRQLFVNGERAPRTRLPEEGFYEVEDPLLAPAPEWREQYKNAARDRFIYREGDIKPWKNLQDVNVMVLHYWQEDYLPIKEIDTEKREVVFSANSYMPFFRSHPAHTCGNAWYYVENIFEELNDPGEWYLDRASGDLFYIPKEGEKIGEVEVYAPVMSQIIKVKGNSESDRYAGNVHFKGLNFRHNSIVWDAHFGTGNNFHNSGPAMLSFSKARDCSVSECEFLNTGEYAIEIYRQSENIYVTGNQFSDMGAGAVKISGGSYIFVTDNEIHSGGEIFHGAAAIVSGQLKHARFLHNHISDFYFNAIKGTGGRKSLYVGAPGTYDNLIMNNHIHDLGKGWLSDMGGIAWSGLEPGALIKNNVVYNIEAACYGGNAIYLDAASQHIIVEKNLLFNTSHAIINFKGEENVIRNNILAFGDKNLLRRASPLSEEMSVANVYKNILLVNNSHPYHTRHEIPVLTPGFWSDLNVIWNIGDEPLSVAQPKNFGEEPDIVSFADWIEFTGNDIHSLIKDPGFKDPLNGDFTLPDDSFIYDYGIELGDFNNIGPRPREEWELTKSSLQNKVESSKHGHIE